MDEQLLKEFLIIEYDGNLIIKPTDKAYKLLGLNEKTKKLRNGAIIDSIDDYYYRIAFLTFLKNNYTINGLVRESSGNSHDASWEKEVIIFNEGGSWKEELDKYKFQEGSTYETKPVVFNEDMISKEIIERWAESYDLSYNGESQRLIYCSYDDGSDKMIYSIERCCLLGSANDKMFEDEISEFPFTSIFLKRKNSK